ncbi:MAG: outer membrane lipoprotein-sorting protein [Acidobacteriota bacterium]
MLGKLLGVVALSALVVVPVAAQSVDDVLAKNADAKGGLVKIKAVKTMRATGKVTLGPGIEAPIILEQKRPKMMRMEITVQGLTIVQAYDGTTGWMLNPMSGRKDPEPMPSEMVKSVEDQADMDGPLIDYKDKGNKVELLGKDKAEGADCFKVKVTLKSGDTRTYYIDAENFLEVKVESRTSVRGTDVEGETIISDWKDVAGMMMPFSIDAGQKGAPARQKITLEKIDVNPALDDARFKMPEVKPEIKK